MRTSRAFVVALSLLAAACQTVEDRERDAVSPDAEPTPGALVFARTYAGADASSMVAAHSVVCGPGDDIWISGHYAGRVDFGAGAIESTGAGSFVTRFDPQGHARWTVRVDSAGAHQAKGITVDAEGNAFVGSVVSLTKLSPTGEVLWTKRPVVEPRDAMFRAGDIAADGAGGVVLLGWSEVALHVGAVTIPTGAFVVDLDAKGELRWSNRFQQTSSDYLPIGLAVDGAGNTVIAQGTNKGNLLRLTKLDPAGATRWVEHIHKGPRSGGTSTRSKPPPWRPIRKGTSCSRAAATVASARRLHRSSPAATGSRSSTLQALSSGGSRSRSGQSPRTGRPTCCSWPARGR